MGKNLDFVVHNTIEETKSRIINLIENEDGCFETQIDLIESIIQKIKDLI